MALDLTSLNLTSETLESSPEFMAALLTFIAGILLLVVMVSIALYVYTSFAYMAIGRKAKLKTPGLAWIPGVGPLILAFQASKMHWWPWLLLIGVFIPFVNFIASIAFTVFAIIWQWKLLEAIRKPGWWILLNFIPILGTIIWLVLLGIAAWSKK
jgi:uncharacterized membrane protein YhaH (DUF805 family)